MKALTRIDSGKFELTCGKCTRFASVPCAPTDVAGAMTMAFHAGWTQRREQMLCPKCNPDRKAQIEALNPKLKTMEMIPIASTEFEYTAEELACPVEAAE